MPESPQRSNASASLIVGLAAAVILALGVGVLVYNRQPQEPGPPPAGPAAGDAVGAPATAAGTPAGQPAAGGAAPAGRSAGPAAIPEAPAGASASETREAATPQKGSIAGRPPERPPLGGSRGTAGAPPPLTVQAMLRRAFVPSRTASENVKGVSKTLSGFDSRKSKEVKVKRAPEIDGRIEFSTTPVRVKPGDKYSLRVSLVNEGKRPIEVKEIAVTTTVNRKDSSATVKPLVKQVAPRQNEVIHEISGTWDKSTSSFAVDVRVMSSRLDVYRNGLVWK